MDDEDYSDSPLPSAVQSTSSATPKGLGSKVRYPTPKPGSRTDNVVQHAIDQAISSLITRP